MDMWHGIRDSHGCHFAGDIVARAALETLIETGHKAMLFAFAIEIIERDKKQREQNAQELTPDKEYSKTLDCCREDGVICFEYFARRRAK